MTKKILLVEDDDSLGETLKERLEREDYGVIRVSTVKDAGEALKGGSFDLAIIDVGLPDGNGFALAREVKFSTRTPVIFLTAMNSAEYRLEGFEIGADDYIPKPFHLKELLLRVAKVLGDRSPDSVVRSADIKLHIDSMSVEFSDGRIEYLQGRDFELLRFLIESAPAIVSRHDVVRKIWHTDEETTPRTVDNSIVRIRSALGDGAGSCIRSVRGVGYQWIAG